LRSISLGATAKIYARTYLCNASYTHHTFFGDSTGNKKTLDRAATTGLKIPKPREVDSKNIICLAFHEISEDHCKTYEVVKLDML
jgi:hypothetical protein